MNPITFGARFERDHGFIPKPPKQNWRAGQRIQTEFMKEPVLQHVLKTTPDEIVFTLDAHDTDSDKRHNKITVEIEREEDNLPDTLKKYVKPVRIGKTFVPEAILD